MKLRRASAALALPLALSLAACGGDDDEKSSASEDTSTVEGSTDASPSPSADESGAADEGDDATDSKASPSKGPAVGASKPGADVTPKEFGDLLAAAFEKATTAKVSMKNEARNVTTSFSGDIDFTGDSPELAITMSGGALPNETKGDLRLVDGALYMDTGMSGGKFVKIPAADAAAAGLDLNALDPSTTAGTFSKAAKSIQYAGEERAGGDVLHHYALKLDPTRMKIDKSVLAQYPKMIDYDIWFDDAGLVRKIDMQIGKLGSTSVTYDNWGAPVTIAAPPAGDVIERPDMPDSPQG